jgi:putative membrane-bound dehydrogenase-like protein
VTCLLRSTLIAAVLATPLRAQSPADLSASFAVPPGCSVSLWAESPLLYNPTAIDIDPQGRVWVTEAVNYRQWDGRNPGMHRDEGDRVVVLEDKDGDGVAETSTVFAQDKDLVAPLGICWLPDKVLVSCSPTVWAYYDDDHDGKADRKEVFLTGFGGHDHDHGAHSFSVGPDGRLYMALGNAGPHIVTDKSGWTLRSGSCYTGGGQFEAPNKPGLVSDDGHVYVGGLILRCNQDGTGLTVMAHNFRNPYEVAVDAFGDMWTFDNDDDGNQCCRATWVMEGGNYGYFSADGSRYWQADKRPGQGVFRAHWHQDDPGVVPTTLITGSGGPTGVCVYEGDALPGMNGALLCADAGRSCVYALKRVPDGAGFKLLPVEGAPPVNGLAPDGQQLTGLLVSKPAKDGDETWHLFRPSDVCVAPDGSVIVADWFDPGVGGHMAQDRKAYGRLLRISAKGSPSGLAQQAHSMDGLGGIGLEVSSPCIAVRAIAAAALHRGQENPIPKFAEIAESAAPMIQRARAIWGISDPWRHEPTVVSAPNAPGHVDHWTDLPGFAVMDAGQQRFTGDLNLVYLRAAQAGSTWLWPLWNESNELHPPTSRQFLAWMNPSRQREFLPDDRRDAMEAALDNELTCYDYAADRILLEAAGLAWEGREPRFLHTTAVWPQGKPGEPGAWSNQQAAFAWRLHPDALVAAFATRVMSTSLDHAAREQSLTALAFCTTREAGEAMLAAALAGPADTRELAAWWVKHNDGNVWRDYGLAQHIVAQTTWTDADIVWRSGPVTHGSVPVDVNISGSKRIALVVTPSDNGNGCDWSDWLDPMITFSGGCDPWSLASEPPAWLSASAEWGSVHVGRNCDGGPLSVDGTKFDRGLGTHAQSEIAFDVPYCPGVKTVLTARAAVDDGGSKQPNAPTKVEFLVYADHALEKERQAESERGARDQLLATLRDRTRSADERSAAGEKLASDPLGGAKLLSEAQAGRLLPLAGDDVGEILAALTEAIFRNPDPGLRALASEHFKRPGSPALPPVAQIAALAGDRHAGAALFFGAARCSTCHAVNGRGGDVGPDLTQIRTKYGREQLLDSILNPSAAIGAGFESVTLALKDGTVLAGLIQADGAQVLLKDGTGKRHVIDAADIAERRASKLSLMPDDIAYSLKPQQLADLCAFLQHDPTTPPKLGPPIELWNGRDLTGWVAVPDPSAWSVRDVAGMPILHDEGQPIGYIRTERPFTSFDLTVEWRFPDLEHPGNSGVLLRVQTPDKVWPRSIESQLDSGNAGDIWNIDAFGMDVDPARTDGRRTVKLQPSSEKPLGEWNTYHITLRDGDLVLEVNGQVQNRARWCEELPGSIALQSEGAPIEFRRVTLREIEE